MGRTTAECGPDQQMTQLLRYVHRRAGEYVYESLRIANLQAQFRFAVIYGDIVAQSGATQPSHLADRADWYRAFQSINFRQKHKVEREFGDHRKCLFCDGDEQTVAGPTPRCSLVHVNRIIRNRWEYRLTFAPSEDDGNADDEHNPSYRDKREPRGKWVLVHTGLQTETALYQRQLSAFVLTSAMDRSTIFCCPTRPSF